MGTEKTPLSLNQRVLIWAHGKVGKKVGRGECWDLAEQALQHAGALTSTDLGPVEADTDYIWGKPISDLKDVQPGDILQIRDHVVDTRTVTIYTFPDTSTQEQVRTEMGGRPHHTAIVDSLPDRNGTLLTIEQNVENVRVVKRTRLHTRGFETVTAGTARFPHPRTNKPETAKFVRTVTVTVTGSLWAYRPTTTKSGAIPSD